MKKSKKQLIHLDDLSITEEQHAFEVGLTDEEYERIKRLLSRRPNKVELGIVAALWSEHCSYKSTKAHLSHLPSKGPLVLVGPGENAGAIDIGDNLAVIFKIESHNHPSFIEPFHGAATGVGGILRDVFTMGARPFALANFLRFGEPNHPKTAHLFHGVVSGIAHYGNCFGTPTVLSNIDFHKSYNGNILVNAFAIGVVAHSDIFLASAQGVKNRVLYVGAKTGRDGIMGAVMASDSFSEDIEQKRPTVQVGDPFVEKLLLEACLQAFKENLVVGIQDMGAAGLTSSSFEMACKASTGLSLNLDLVPLRDETMSAYDIMLSESQERMLMVVKPSAISRLNEIFSNYELDCVDIGQVTGDGIVKIVHKGHEVVNMAASLITENAPRYRRSYLSDVPKNRHAIKDSVSVSFKDAMGSFRFALGHKDLRFVTSQFDHHIGLSTIVGPNQADAALIRVPATSKAVAISLVGLEKLSQKNPKEAAKRSVYRALLEISCQGATPQGITNCLNFGSPENIHVMTDLKWTIDGMAEAAENLNIPIISGNVSLYNETSGQPIMPTLSLGLVGLTDNCMRFTKCSNAAHADLLVSLGEIPDDYAGCEVVINDNAASTYIRPWDTHAVMRLADTVRYAVEQGIIKCASVIGRGGFLKSLAQIMAHSGQGATIDFGAEWLLDEIAIGLISENSPQILVCVSAENLEQLTQICAGKVPLAVCGRMGFNQFIIRHGGQEIHREQLDTISSCYLDHVGEVFANT